MKSKWHMPHPATMFLLLTLVVIFISWIFDIYGLSVSLPQTGEEIRVQSLLSPEGIRWLLRHVVTNFTGFAPLGLVIVAMFGIGVAQHSGFIDACIRKSVRKQRQNPWRIVTCVIILGLLSNVVGDAGYIILIPIAATLFLSVGLHPIGGIITAYVSVSCGYSANILLSTLDPLIATTTQEAADQTNVSLGKIGPLSNYYFLFVSTFLLIFLIYYITRKNLLPALGDYMENVNFLGYKQLSRKERRAILGAFVVGLLYVMLILWATFSSWGILRGVNGGLIHSPFIVGILFLLSFGIGLMGMVYGFASGRYRTDGDVIEGLTQPMKLLGVYFVIAFFAAQMFACFEYSHLDKCIAILGADLLSSLRLGSLWILILFILFTALINLIMVSATSKWAFMSFIFVPVLAGMGISPDVTQCAYRIGDSATNAITPFMFYMPLVLTYMQQYDKQSTYGSLLKYTWRYSLAILLAWTALFILWYITGLPLGL
ncbi:MULTISPECIES: AbgT family transporter [Bacteroides]|jgi:aminobenzoyl-glutamate transport protein|uniref:AbgT family transporter n=1 Tax=Bacteroides TaxID=816 RepID=UPI000C772462|nr:MULTISPECIES: AbgT family transporter [Bacteroides]RGM44822.1 AbgT family transporter [Bacteroides sp. OM08-11]